MRKYIGLVKIIIKEYYTNTSKLEIKIRNKRKQKNKAYASARFLIKVMNHYCV